MSRLLQLVQLGRLNRLADRLPRMFHTNTAGQVAGGGPARFPSCGPTRTQIERWRQYSPAQRLASQHYWRAKRANDNQPNGYWTAAQWERLCARTNWRCAYCGEPSEQLSPDHIQPLAHGGTNDFANIAPVCLDCQRKKSAKPAWQWFTPDEYERLMQWLHPEAA